MGIPTGNELPQDIGAIRNLFAMPVIPAIYTSSQNSSVDDLGKLIVMNSGSGLSYTILADSAMSRPIPQWQTLTFLQLGSGLVTLVQGSGASLTGPIGLKSAGQGAIFGAIKVAADTWLTFGNTAA